MNNYSLQLEVARLKVCATILISRIFKDYPSFGNARRESGIDDEMETNTLLFGISGLPILVIELP